MHSNASRPDQPSIGAKPASDKRCGQEVRGPPVADEACAEQAFITFNRLDTSSGEASANPCLRGRVTIATALSSR